MTKDRSFFSNIGQKKQEMLISLCNLLDKKGIDYNTIDLAKMSRDDIIHMRHQLTGNPIKKSHMTNSFESRGRITDD